MKPITDYRPGSPLKPIRGYRFLELTLALGVAWLWWQVVAIVWALWSNS
jgi:hypothetical protein